MTDKSPLLQHPWPSNYTSLSRQHSSKQWTCMKMTQLNQKQDKCLTLSSPSHFSLFNCCLSVVLWLDKGDYLENSHLVFCPNKQCSFKPFMCLDLLLAFTQESHHFCLVLIVNQRSHRLLHGSYRDKEN